MQPTAPALVDEDRTISYGELAELVLRASGHLNALGVRRGDYVGLCLKDDWQHVVAMLAAARLGAIFLQIDPRTRPVEKARIAAAFDFKLIVTAPGADAIASCAMVPLDSVWERRVAQTEAPAALPDEWHDPMVVQSTSGTTGRPKFSVATHLQFYFRLASLCEYTPTTRPHRYLATLPLFSALGRNVFMLHLLHGSTIILYPSIFTATEFVETATKHHASVAAVAPSSVRQLLEASDSSDPLLPRLELLICGGAPLFADEKLEAVRKLTPNFHEMYGVSAFGPISVLRPKDMHGCADTAGRPFSLAEVEIVDETDRPVASGEIGRLRCRGPALASPIAIGGENADDFRDGWHYPGEVAALDECGYLHLHGRTSEVVFRGGAKVFPTEIEAVLQAHEKVADAAVVACGPSVGEQELAAYVVANGEVTPGQLLAHCRQQLTPHKVPRQIHIVAELPRNLLGKVDKRALASWSGAPARVNA
jgi:acyl-CoA synthetase (AMP-forming)/AMP-acid ligase II